MGIGGKIAKFRSERGMTQKDLADKALVNANYLAAIEEGRKKPHLKLIARLASVLDVTIEALVESDMEY
jgi:transcriptional regulator with XRE-family HTH domain